MSVEMQVALISVLCTGATSAGVVSIAYLRHKYQRELAPRTYNPWPELDQWGFRAELDWSFVATLEHDMGYPHTSESKSHCKRAECWEEVQSPEYQILNGFLTIASFPELPVEKGTFDPSPPALEFTEKGTLKNELAARKARANGYIPASITAEEAGVRGFESGSRTINELRAMPTEPSDRWHHAEYTKLESLISEQLQNGKTMALPAGYTITYRRGGDLAHVESPTGLSVWIDIPSYRDATAADRRRDELFKSALDSLKNYAEGSEKELT